MKSQVLTVSMLLLTFLGGCDYFRSASARIQRAEDLMATQQYRAASIELKNALEQEPNNPQAHLLFADILLHLSEPDAAAQELQKARANNANVADSNELDMRIKLALGRYDEVIAALTNASDPTPEPQRSLHLAAAYLGLRRYDDALGLFERVKSQQVDTQVGKLEAQLGSIEARTALGQSEQALAELKSITAAHPEAAAAWSLQASLLLRASDTQKAEASLLQAHRHAAKQLTVKQHAEVLGNLVELRLGRRDFAAADQSHRDLSAILPGSLMTALLRARISFAKQDYANAASGLQRIVRTAPDVAPAQFLLGAVLLQQGNIHQAEQHLARAVSLAPQHLEARKLLAQAQLRLDRPQAAIQSLLPALDDPGLDLQLHGLLGLAEKQAGLESNAIEYLTQAVNEQPDNGARRLELATAYLRGGKFAEAIVHLRAINDSSLAAQRAAMLTMAIANQLGVGAARAELETQLARNPKNVAMLSVAGEFFGRIGQQQRGIDVLTTAIVLAPRDTSLLSSRARLLAAHGDAVAAERDLKAALAINNNDRGVLMSLADLNYRRGNISASIEWLDRLGKSEPGNVQIDLLKARALLSAKQAAQTQQATDLLSRLTAAHPERSDVRTAIARLYVSAGRYEEALAQLRSAAGLSKEDGSIQLEIARTQVALSQFDDARNTVDALLQRTPSDLSTVALAAWLDIERGAKASAAARIAALRKQQPDEPRVRLAQGEILMAVGDPQAAVEAFESALKQMPASNVAFKAYLARAAAKLPNTTGPLEGYVESHPRDVSARAALAQALQESGQAGPAIKQYEKLLADGGPSAIALNNLAWLYHQVGDQRALATARQAVHLAPGNPAVVDTLGWILIRQNQAQEGVAILKTVLSRAANQSEIHYHYAVGLTKVGARGEARRVLTEALAQPIPFSGRDDAQRLLTELSSDAPVKG